MYTVDHVDNGSVKLPQQIVVYRTSDMYYVLPGNHHEASNSNHLQLLGMLFNLMNPCGPSAMHLISSRGQHVINKADKDGRVDAKITNINVLEKTPLP